MRSRSERTTLGRTRLGRTATILMMDRIHQVLADAPRIRILHVGRRRDDDRKGLTPVLLVVSAVPRAIHRKVVRPNLSFGHRIRCTGDLLRGGGVDRHACND